MALADLLAAHRAAILKRWHQLILETYPPDAARFLEREGDRFLNPVGHTISQEIETLFAETVHGMDPERVSRSLDGILRIRAVQEYSPSAAVAPILLLKNAVREELAAEIRQQAVGGELLEFESRVDRLLLLAFDSYMQCRQKIYEIRVNEASKRSAVLVDRLNRVFGNQESDADLEDPGSDHVSRGSTK